MRRKILLLLIFLLIVVKPAYSSNEAIIGIITGQAVNIRAEPHSSALVVAVINRDHLVTVLGSEDTWFKIRYNDKMEGWVFKDYVSLDPEVIAQRNYYLTKTRELTNFAKCFLGVRYSYGGSTPTGFDCSGYTRFVYARFGFILPHSAQAQMRLGQIVSRQELTEGDLVFFSSLKALRVNHVGIYLGLGEFIHASSGRGKVRIGSLEDTYYRVRYRGGRRVFKLRHEA